jgi:hypothetical protein
MASLSSTSTIAEIEAAYADNAGYAEDNSPSKARAFITACRLLLLKRPTEAGSGTDRLVLSPEQIAASDPARARLARRATTSVTTPRSGPRVTRVSFQNWQR